MDMDTMYSINKSLESEANDQLTFWRSSEFQLVVHPKFAVFLIPYFTPSSISGSWNAVLVDWPVTSTWTLKIVIICKHRSIKIVMTIFLYSYSNDSSSRLKCKILSVIQCPTCHSRGNWETGSACPPESSPGHNPCGKHQMQNYIITIDSSKWNGLSSQTGLYLFIVLSTGKLFWRGGPGLDNI